MNDDAFTALSNENRRRLLLELIDDPSHPATGNVRADVAAGHGTGESGVETAMYHQHLPMLAESGFIEWDAETHEIGVGPRFEELRRLLEVVADATPS